MCLLAFDWGGGGVACVLHQLFADKLESKVRRDLLMVSTMCDSQLDTICTKYVVRVCMCLGKKE